MVPAPARLNRDRRNAASCAEGRTKRKPHRCGLQDSIPDRNRRAAQRRTGLSFCGFNDCTFRKV